MSNQVLDILGPVPCVHFGALLVAKAYKNKGEPKYSANFLHKPDDPELASIKEAAVAVAKAKWPGRDIGADFRSGELKMPWALGDALADRRVAKLKKEGKEDDKRGDYQRGFVVVKAGSKNAPRLAIYDATGKPGPELEGAALQANKGKLFSGVKVSYEINLVAMDAVGEDGKDRVVAYLNLVCSTGKGERVGGGRTASEAFSGYAGKAKQEDPTAGAELDYEIPF